MLELNREEIGEDVVGDTPDIAEISQGAEEIPVVEGPKRKSRPTKKNLLLINKSDLLTQTQRYA